MHTIDMDQERNTIVAIAVGAVILVLLCIFCVIYMAVKMGCDIMSCVWNVISCPCRFCVAFTERCASL